MGHRRSYHWPTMASFPLLGGVIFSRKPSIVKVVLSLWRVLILGKLSRTLIAGVLLGICLMVDPTNWQATN